jgi:hypothetical protein
MPISLELRHVITVDHLKQPVMLHTKQIDCRTFFKVTKADPQLARLLVQKKYKPEHRPLARTDVIERIVRIRNAALHEFLVQPPDVEEGKEDIGIDGPRKARKVAEVVLPESLIVRIPDVEGVRGIDMRIELCTGRSWGLWAELTVENIEFLTTVVNRQIASGEIHHHHPSRAGNVNDRMDMTMKSGTVTHARTRNAIRAVQNVEGKQVTKFFKIGHDVSEAIGRATAWSTSSIAT